MLRLFKSLNYFKRSVNMSEPISKNEQKRRLKAEEKSKSKVEINKEAEVKVNEDEMDSQQFYEMRKEHVNLIKSKGIDTHPHFYKVDIDLKTYLDRYNSIAIGTHTQDVLSVQGRVMAKRESGAKLLFLDIVSGGYKLQVLANQQYYESEETFVEIRDQIKMGDIVGVRGHPGTSKLGEPSIIPIAIVVVTPCMRQLPHQHYGLKDQETRYRRRYLDLMMNPEVRERFIKRTQIINYVKSFLNKLGCLEVQTPMLQTIPGGAAAKPFETHHNDFNMKMFLRIAPELHLKELVVGGLERVYELGTQFRNEGCDLTHNPEFTTCEAYIAFADYNTWMSYTEELVSGLALELHGSYKVNYSSHGENVVIDFTPPFARMDLMTSLEKELGMSLPKPTELSTEGAREMLDKICVDRKVDCSGARTVARLLDKLVGEYLESKCINPTYIINHPEIMSPLAKYHRTIPGLTERFELFVMKKELANSYTELNDYEVQRERFVQQAKDKSAGDDEAMFIDETFLDALAYGLPPCGGWGLGIDRLVMFLTNTESIKEVLLFPTMKPEQQVVTKVDSKI